MTPFTIELLLHAHCTPEPHERMHVAAVVSGFEELEVAGLICKRDGRYRTTAMGVAHVAQLCALPFPVQGWIGADGKVINP